MLLLRDLPYPPSVNHYWVHSRRGVRISEKGKVYRAAVYLAVRPLIAQPILGKIYVGITMNVPDMRRRDLDNILKALFDALQHARVYKDDNQIKLLVLFNPDHVTPGGSVDVALYRAGHDGDVKALVRDLEQRLCTVAMTN